MFKPNTILARRDDPSDRLRVIGPSPVQIAAAAEWEGSGGQAVVVTNADHFGENTPAPIAWLNLRYEVVEEPLPPQPLTFDRPVPTRGLTPEEQFAAMARTNISEMVRVEEEAAEQAKAQAEALAEGAEAERIEVEVAAAIEQAAKTPEKPKTGRSTRPKDKS